MNQTISPHNQFLAEQVRLACEVALKIPIGAVLANALLAYAAWSHQAPLWALLWFVAFFIAQLVRIPVAKAFLRGERSAESTDRFLVCFSAIVGTLTGLGLLLCMAYVSAQLQPLAAMVVFCLVAGAVPAFAFRATNFKAYAVPCTVALCVAWILFGKIEPRYISSSVGLLSILFLPLASFYVKTVETAQRTNFLVSAENARLVNELRLKQEEVTKERDLAQRASLAKSRFLASASHDLRQPLQTISMYNAALGLQRLDEKAKDLVSREGIAISSLSSLLNALLDVSQIETKSLEAHITEVAIAPIFERIANEFQNLALNRGVTFEFDAPKFLAAHSDPILLERVLRNLLDNAFKHGARESVHLQARAQGKGHVEIEVADDGKGIPSEEREHIFEEFYQLNNPERDRQKGLGLGLAIVKKLCSLMDAKVRVASESGSTQFFIELPRAPDRLLQEIPPPPSALDTSALRQARILLLDDDEHVGRSLQALLQAHGCVVDVCVEQAQASQHLHGEPYLALLLDYRLRHGRTGLDFFHEHQSKLETTAVIVISGDAGLGAAAEAEKAGLPVLRKPIDPDELLRLLCDIAKP